MINLNINQLDKINLAALLSYPNEMCGILTEEDFIQLSNIHTNPRTNFKLSAQELLPFLGKISAIVHSHCYETTSKHIFDFRTPSVSDIQGQADSGVPWLIISCNGTSVSPALEFPRQPSNVYVGRPFIWLVSDCYSLVQDFYFFELGITLPNHKARTDYRNIQTSNNLFDDFISEYKFRVKTPEEFIKTGDLLLLNHRGNLRNHLGIYSKGKVIHQDHLSVEIDFERIIPYLAEVLVYEG